VDRISQSLLLVTDISTEPVATCGLGGINPQNCLTDSFIWDIPLTFPVYVMIFLSFIGWWFFTLFTGVGLIALPMDLINEFRTRPTPMKTATYFEQRATLGQRAKSLVEVGETMKRKSKEVNGMMEKRSWNKKKVCVILKSNIITLNKIIKSLKWHIN